MCRVAQRSGEVMSRIERRGAVGVARHRYRSGTHACAALAAFCRVRCHRVVKESRYDTGGGVEPTAINAVSVGNLTVGGTGKTPFAAWCAQQLRVLGAAPAIVLRGYGDDEWRVHSLLTPGVPVVVGADRVRAIAEAAGLGATVAVLDDAFQHRRASRVADLVLISADAWTGDVRVLPAGPWREPLSALQRASVAVITVKARRQRACRRRSTCGACGRAGCSRGRVHLRAGRLFETAAGQMMTAPDARSTPGTSESGASLASLSGRDVLAVSAIGNPAPFEHALQHAGARVTARRFADHHAFRDADAAALASAVSPHGIAVCTLKDAVKLAPLWPREAPAPLVCFPDQSRSIAAPRRWTALYRASAGERARQPRSTAG